MDSSRVATMAVVPGDSDGGDKDARNGACRVAWPGGYYAAKSPPPIVPMAWGVPKHQPTQAATKRRK